MDSTAISKESVRRAKEILKTLTPAQKALVTDPAYHVSGLCPRRAGKTYAACAAALITGEAKSGSISLIISLNLKQLKRLYWSGGAAGLFAFDRKFGLGLDFNKTEARWEHQNGSIGYLLGTADAEQLEVIRGLEADLYIVDECKSIAPFVMDELIDDVIDPQRSTRGGRLILIGTPGNVMAGSFYEATCTSAVDADNRPFTITPGTTDEWNRTAESDLLWSAHSWTLEDNVAAPWQWKAALVKKRSKKWSDNDPKWMREYLGKWTNSTEGTVYRYNDEKRVGKPDWVNWVPNYDKVNNRDNPTGLPSEGAPWRIIGGLDIAFEDDTALVVGAYSQKLGELRHVWDCCQRHLLPDDVVDLLREAERRYGKFEMIYADTSGGKQVVEHIKKAGFSIEAASKREKYDAIELLNNAFHRGEVKIIARENCGWESKLEHQLITDAWNLGDHTFAEAARRGRLIEDASIPNDAADAWLYMFRGAMHRFGPEAAPVGPDYMSPDWIKRWEKAQLVAARKSEGATPFDRALSGKNLNAPAGLTDALSRKRPWTNPSGSSSF